MKARNAVSAGVLLLLLTSSLPLAHAIGINGGNGLTYVKSAWNLKPGYLTLYGRTRFFGKVSTQNQPTAVTYWDVQGALSFNYGITDHVELAIAPVMYQDTHRGQTGYNIPDDLFLGLKLGSYNLKGTSLTWAVSFDTRFPTAKYHNVPFEPYSAGTIEWGFTTMLTYARDPLYPDDNLNIHANFGYVNHNDVGKKLLPRYNISVTNMSQQFIYGFGMKIPSSEFDFSIELYGNKFLQRPPLTAYSLEDYIYLSPGISYHAYRWMTLSFSTDLRLSEDVNQSLVAPPAPDLPNYPGWRINLGLSLTLLPTSVYRLSDKDILIRKAESRRELFEQIIKEQRETESAEEELERIKEERRKAERELERLRRILEGDLKKKKEDSNNK
ncbi:MAG: transporter [candidate division KSB1 bacterium]|nr:transporter [candidate division KSB1 bacterium]MDZ7335575.1 transporter [candidate division KSB1 bacterium]MDZ7356447.1 transporter [candidate division KSB1 bacterium]MDZ7401218.1 transporter [candidate division KSB1 bacterium]